MLYLPISIVCLASMLVYSCHLVLAEQRLLKPSVAAAGLA